MVGDYPGFNYNPPNEDYGISVVSRRAQAFADAALELETLDLNAVTVRVVTLETLCRTDAVQFKLQE